MSRPSRNARMTNHTRLRVLHDLAPVTRYVTAIDEGFGGFVLHWSRQKAQQQVVYNRDGDVAKFTKREDDKIFDSDDFEFARRSGDRRLQYLRNEYYRSMFMEKEPYKVKVSDMKQKFKTVQSTVDKPAAKL